MSGRPHLIRRQKGLTLVEVLVAFAILAGLVAAILVLIGQNAQYMLSAEERLLASVAADNLMTNDLAVAATPEPGEEEGKVMVAGQTFGFLRITKDIGEKSVLMEYRISRDSNDQTLARVSAMKAKP